MLRALRSRPRYAGRRTTGSADYRGTKRECGGHDTSVSCGGSLRLRCGALTAHVFQGSRLRVKMRTRTRETWQPSKSAAGRTSLRPCPETRRRSQSCGDRRRRTTGPAGRRRHWQGGDPRNQRAPEGRYSGATCLELCPGDQGPDGHGRVAFEWGYFTGSYVESSAGAVKRVRGTRLTRFRD